MQSESLTLKIPLTDEEQRDLVRREEYIEENLQTLFSVGKAFADIRDRKLYRESHRTFEEYCRERWQISRPRAYQLIDASVIQETVSTNVDKNMPLPTNESQTRALKKAPKEKQPELWEKAVSQNNGKSPSARQIIQVIETDEEEAERLRDVQEAVLTWGKTQTPYPEEAIMRWSSINSQLNVDYVRDIKQAYLSQYNNDPTLNDLIITQAAICKETVERMLDVSLHFASSIGGGAFRCEMCDKHIVSGYGFYYPKTNTYRCYHCATEPTIALEARLKRCQTCIGKYYFANIDGGHGITHIYEINSYMGLVRGVTYPYPPKSQKWGAKTANFELEDLRKEVTQTDWELAKKGEQPQLEQKPEPEPEAENKHECYCIICQSWQKDVYGQRLNETDINDRRGVCRKCAQKALIELLDPKDPEIIEECVEQWNHGFEPRRTKDLDKIIRSGIFRIFRISNYEKVIKEYTKAKSTVAEVDSIDWGSWKTFEKFQTKKAMYARAAELQQDEHVIFEGKAT